MRFSVNNIAIHFNDESNTIRASYYAVVYFLTKLWYYRDPFPRKEHVYSKEDLDQQLDQFMSHTKQKRDEELNRVIQEHS